MQGYILHYHSRKEEVRLTKVQTQEFKFRIK